MYLILIKNIMYTVMLYYATADKHLPLLLHDNIRESIAIRVRVETGSWQLLNICVSKIMEDMFYVVFGRRFTWRLHIEMTETNAFRIFIRVYSLFKSERLSANIKSTLHKALIKSVMTYASLAWEFAADTHLIKLQRLQNKVLRTIDNFPRCIPGRDLHMAFKIPYVYDYITKICR
jgi:hypothetical protein